MLFPVKLGEQRHLRPSLQIQIVRGREAVQEGIAGAGAGMPTTTELRCGAKGKAEECAATDAE